jgi:hypothetical protein
LRTKERSLLHSMVPALNIVVQYTWPFYAHFDSVFSVSASDPRRHAALDTRKPLAA